MAMAAAVEAQRGTGHSGPQPAGPDPPGLPACPCRVGRVCSGGEAGLRRAMAAAGGGAKGCGLVAAAGGWGCPSGERPQGQEPSALTCGICVSAVGVGFL